jgi:hypothetical protein
MIEKEGITGTINAHQSSTAPISLFKPKSKADIMSRSVSGRSGTKMYAQYLRDERTRTRRHSATRSEAPSKVDSARAFSSMERRSRPSHATLAAAEPGFDFGEKTP